MVTVGAGNVIADTDFLPALWPFRPVRHGRLERMRGRVNTHIGCKKRPVSNSHDAGIQDRGIEVDVHIFTKLQVCAVIHPDGGARSRGCQ